MGTTLSRCTSKHSSPSSSTPSEVSQRVFEKQPNWLTAPSRWRMHCNPNPVRYRTPTPYPKEDRKRLEDITNDTASVRIGESEKVVVIEAPVVQHIEVRKPFSKHKQLQAPRPSFHEPRGSITISWESSARLNRFERVA
ncbi:hypothetical protein B0J18DRAFT_291574 [Chaetomium sp. MPI-SDFR-AT-0129]|nr:hypothetical protein B0J18DRAFT_291574 [Chaetomium sp. MPI-SDFR-AT-0129]